MAAVGRPRRLSEGTGLAGPAHLVLWGHAARNGRGSDGCWKPRCAPARAFVLWTQLVAKYLNLPRSVLRRPVEDLNDLWCFELSLTYY